MSMKPTSDRMSAPNPSTPEATRTAEERAVKFPDTFPFECSGPCSVGEWSYVTDLNGFFAIRESGHPAASAGNSAMARHLLAIASPAFKPISLAPLREFLKERCEIESENTIVTCRIFGCVVDANVVNRWLPLVSQDQCHMAASSAPMRQKPDGGEALILEGDNWRLIIAGVKSNLKYPPAYDVTKVEAQ